MPLAALALAPRSSTRTSDSAVGVAAAVGIGETRQIWVFWVDAANAYRHCGRTHTRQDSKQFATRVRWATNFGGVTTSETYATLVRGLLASLVRSPDYSAGDVLRTVRGIAATQAALLPELATMDLAATVPRLDVPVMVQGRLDQVAPGAAVRQRPEGTEKTAGVV